MQRKVGSGVRVLSAAVGVALSIGGGLWADDLPSIENGTLTLDVAAGVTTTYTEALPAATTLVKTGPGCAVLSVASTAFKGNVDIREGTLQLTDREAAGTGTKIEVTGDAATLHLNFPRPDGANANTMFFSGHDVTIRGKGADGKGAFRYTATSDGMDDNMLDSLTLSDDAFIAVPTRFGIRNKITLNGHALTRADAPNEWIPWIWNSPSCTIDAGIISNLVGCLTAQRIPTFSDPDNTTFCMAGGRFLFWVSDRPLPCRVVWDRGGLYVENGTSASCNIISGDFLAEKDLAIYHGHSTYRIEFTGPTAVKGKLSHSGKGLVYLNGPTDAKSLYVSSEGGRLVCSSNVTRRVGWDGLVLNAVNTRLDLEDGLLSGRWFRLGNGWWGRSTFVQSGGTFLVEGDTFAGEANGSYGAWLMTGGTAIFSNEVHFAKLSGSEGILWQSGGLLQTKQWGRMLIGGSGRGFYGVFNGATNDTRTVKYGNDVRLHLGDSANGRATLAVSGAGSVIDTEDVFMGYKDVVSTNVVAVTDGGTLKARRFFRDGAVAAGSANDVYVDGGTVMPTFWAGWNNVDSTASQFLLCSPDFWTIGPRGMVIDTSELEGVENEAALHRHPSDWPHPLSDATGRGLASVELPVGDSAFAAEAYYGPVFVDVEGPAGSHGAAAMAAFDPVEKKLTHVVVVSPGCGYDETTRVFVRSSAKEGRFECTYTLTEARGGGRLTKRGANAVFLYGANTYTGGTVVEAGTLAMRGERSFPANTALKVMDGAAFENEGRALAVSALSGAGGSVRKCANALSVGEALEISVAELFAASGPLTVDAKVTFAEGAVVRVTDPENLPAHQQDGKRPFLKATGGFAGPIPKLTLTDATGRAWKVFRSGDTLRFGPEWGAVMLVR